MFRICSYKHLSSCACDYDSSGRSQSVWGQNIFDRFLMFHGECDRSLLSKACSMHVSQRAMLFALLRN